VANGIEYVLGGTSLANDVAKLPTVTNSGGNLLFALVLDQASIHTATFLAIEAGENLSDWPQSFPVPDSAIANHPGITVVKDAPAAGRDTVTLTLPLNPSGRTFVRLKATP
jgi:hypothetical protein